ncbi:uncharacterized protein LOC131151014 isoform X2 [Malania oleifera]|uniref:uncharacterized protein LOC131151014 isoform X2 n=1 Tax=Malania oleifera TaxID=397392 RepID=UPI0025AE62EC|nr:uncharacterized protein LOC131151014 isoform X2 [Malania oleifera]
MVFFLGQSLPMHQAKACLTLLQAGLILVISGVGRSERELPIMGSFWIGTCIFQVVFISRRRKFSQASFQLSNISERSSLVQMLINFLPCSAGKFPQSSFLQQKCSCTIGNDDRHIFLPMLPPEELAGHSGSDSQEGTVGCKAGNKNCSSLVEEERSSLLVAMNCNICCSESNFCRDCCCILCCKTVSSAYGGYSFIKCEAKVDEGCICAHVAHMNCALRSYMAGTVGGSIGLDAEYYCRRCDSRTQLVSHVAGLLETCKSLDSRDEIVKILNVGICILRGSQNPSAKQLLDCIELASAQLKSGADPREIWKEDGILAATPEVCHHKNDALKVTSQQSPSDFRTSSQQILSVPDHKNEGLKLEDEIDQVLQELKRSQESEYIIAEERLNAQKNYLLNLYEQLGKEKSELLRCTSGKPDALLDAVLNRQDQIKQEVTNLRVMKEVAKGFGMTSKGILKRHFGLDIKD